AAENAAARMLMMNTISAMATNSSVMVKPLRRRVMSAAPVEFPTRLAGSFPEPPFPLVPRLLPANALPRGSASPPYRSPGPRRDSRQGNAPRFPRQPRLCWQGQRGGAPQSVRSQAEPGNERMRSREPARAALEDLDDVLHHDQGGAVVLQRRLNL